MSNELGGHAATVLGTCGVGLFFNFHSRANYKHMVLKNQTNRGGIGYSVAGFVDTEACRKAYEFLSEKYEIVFQSPVKRNRNSGNMFFFCVFKDK